MADQPGSPSNPKGVPSRASNLSLRVLSSLVLAPLAIAAVVVGGLPFALFWTVAGLIVVWEWTSIVSVINREKVLAAGFAAIAVAGGCMVAGCPGWALVAVAVGAIAAALLASPDRRWWCGAGLIYAGALVLAPIALRADVDFGLLAIVVLFAVVWSTDILGYFAGRAFGGPKLAPSVSPKKTWSGAIGGTLGAVIATVAVAVYAHLPQVALLGCLAVVLSAVSQAGDLLESAVKRHFDVKDASQIIPGHGGVMDRLDGFVTAAAVAALIGAVRGGAEAPARGLLVW